jgi:hypothetical protein
MMIVIVIVVVMVRPAVDHRRHWRRSKGES